MNTNLFGPAIQHAFVVRDMDAALDYWTNIMGVGPFFRVDEASYKSGLYRNAPASPKYAVALAYWGDVQIELIMPTDDQPNIYNEFLDAGFDGLLQHICVTVDSMDDFRRAIDGKGFEILAELALDPEGEVLYLRGDGQDWPLIEVGHFPQGLYDVFDMVKQASIDWDGQDPVRSF